MSFLTHRRKAFRAFNGFGNASRSFDGVNDYIDINNGTSLDTTFQGDFTVAFWVKPDDGIPSSANIIFGTGDSPDSHRVFITCPTTGGDVTFGYKASGTQAAAVTDSAPFTDGLQSWTHVACRHDTVTNQMDIYINGAAVALDATNNGDSSSITTTSWASPRDIRIGMLERPTSGDLYYDGRIADVRIYGEALSSANILGLFNGTDYQTNLVGWWLDDDDDVLDNAGTNDGTNNGTTYDADGPNG